MVEETRLERAERLAVRALAAAERWGEDLDLTFVGVDLRPAMVYDFVQVFNQQLAQYVLEQSVASHGEQPDAVVASDGDTEGYSVLRDG